MDSFRVLVVDDEEEFLETIIKRLRKRDVNVSGAKSGKAALRLLDQYPVDVVVLDIKMPGMGGLQTLKEIKRLFPLIEVVMLTAHASLEAASEGMKLGAFDYLIKPVDIDDLVYKLHDAYKIKFVQKEQINLSEKQLVENG